MAGGNSIWFSKDAKSDPKAIFNPRLFYLLVTVAWSGFFYGFDTGLVALSQRGSPARIPVDPKLAAKVDGGLCHSY